MKEIDPLEEIRAIRDATALRHGGSAESLGRELAAKAAAAGRVTVERPKREPQDDTVKPQLPAA